MLKERFDAVSTILVRRISRIACVVIIYYHLKVR